jgi:myosin heavy subunit
MTSLDVIRLLDEKPLTGAAAKGAAANASKMGLFVIVDDFSKQKPRKTWEALMTEFEKQQKTSTVFVKEKVKEKFKIRHSAKEVIYTVKTFIDRNVDEISTTLESVIIQKGDPTIAKIFSG